MKLTGKVALITNVRHFMGPAITEEFAREGASLALHDRDENALRPLSLIAERLGREVLPLAGDLTRPAEADRVVQAAVARFGRLDVLVNNNAYPPSGTPTDAVTDALWREMMAHLLDEPFYCMRAALRVMRPAGRGKIINMSSAAAFQGLPGYAAYTAARAGVNGLTKAVGREVAREGIQVNAIAQNYVENPTYFPPSLTADAEKLKRIVGHIPAGRLARGEESARLAVYLASEDADFFVGQVIPFAGGWVTP
ncbi:MAG TPA: SDR family oxidoreductase [Methylomirabilota bacterium]|jgi:NAD(P)-dependent dehydrogenase (short-subunit alcohol dehydrogenase family)|nr:SDR family oxidoreductase [Methylomirabilota bacterium]